MIIKWDAGWMEEGVVEFTKDLFSFFFRRRSHIGGRTEMGGIVVVTHTHNNIYDETLGKTLNGVEHR